MTIEFECPNCGEHIEAPDKTGGKKAKCPRCSEPVVIPAQSESRPVAHRDSRPERGRRSRPDEPAAESRSRSGSRRRPDDYDDEPRPSSRRSRRADRDDDDVPTSSGYGALLAGAGVVLVIALVIVAIMVMKKDSGTTDETPQPGTTQEAGQNQPTPTPAPKIDVAKFKDGLRRVGNATPMVLEVTIAKYASEVFGGGKASLELLVTEGIGSDNDDVRRIADKFLAAITNEKSQIDLLYAEDQASVDAGKQFWRDWWNSNKTKSLADIVLPALDKSNTDRSTLAVALGEFRDIDTVPYLFTLMEDTDLNIRSKAFTAMKKLLKNEKLGYSPESGFELIGSSVKEYRDWWDSVKGRYNFDHPENYLPNP